MWSLHPPHRSALFYERLPELINAVEREDIPDGQRGDYDINGSMIDWSSAQRTFWRERAPSSSWCYGTSPAPMKSGPRGFGECSRGAIA